MTKAGTLWRVLLALALALMPLATLQQRPVRANVSAATVTPNPPTAGDPAAYTIDFSTGPAGALTANVSTISITFPSDTTVPSSISRSFVAVNDTPLAVDPTVSGRTVTLITPVAVATSSPVKVAFSQPAGLVNPTLAGTYKVSVFTSSETTPVDSTSYTIVRKLSRSPTSGARGTSTTLSGVGWAPNTTLEIYRDDNSNDAIDSGEPLLATGGVDGTGRFSVSVTANVPPFGAGSNRLIVRDGSGAIATTTFAVNPSLGTPSPTSQRGGGSVTVPMRDFAPVAAGATIGVTVGGAAATVTPTLPGIGSAPTSVTFTVPVTAPVGDVQVVVTYDPDGSGPTPAQTATVTLRVIGADVSLTPSSGPNRTIVTIRATGLTPNGTSTIFFAGTQWNAADIPVDSAGVALISLPLSTAPGGGANDIPVAGTPGTYQVRVVDNAGRQGIATFTIPSRSISLTPAESGRGTTVTVTGTGFSANSTVSFTYAGAAIPGVTATTDANGAFTASFAVPETAGIPSSNAVVATDAAGLTASATHRVPAAAITVAPPEAPAGSNITVRGTGFPGFAAVAITIGALTVTPTPTPVTRADGSFETTITVPAQATGVYIVTATAGGVAASTSFTQTARPTTIADVVAPISRQLVRIWGYDAAAQAWRVYDPAAPALSDLPALVRGQGYWVNVNADVTWTFAGNTYNLRRGWNLIGWLGP